MKRLQIAARKAAGHSLNMDARDGCGGDVLLNHAENSTLHWVEKTSARRAACTAYVFLIACTCVHVYHGVFCARCVAQYLGRCSNMRVFVVVVCVHVHVVY